MALFFAKRSPAPFAVHDRWAEWRGDSYCEEMNRRHIYYDGAQFVQKPGTYTTPEEWRKSWSGPGWDDIVAMLPETTHQSVVYPTTSPVLETIIDNLAVVYSVPPKRREIRLDDERQEDIESLYSKILLSADADDRADQLAKWTELFGTAFQFVSWDDRNKRIGLRNLPPYSVFVVASPESPTDLQHPDCLVAIQYATTTDETAWQVWYREHYWYEDQEGVAYEDTELTKKGIRKNPYGDVKPILVRHKGIADVMYPKTSDNRVQLQQRVDRDLTAWSYTMEYQGFALPVFWGFPPEEMMQVSISPGAAIVIPEGLGRSEAGVEFAHPLSPLSEMGNAIVKKIRLAARSHGIDPDLVDPEKQVSSGVSVAQSRIALAERREEQFNQWLAYERELFWLVAKVWNTFILRPDRRLPQPSRFASPLEDEMFSVDVVFGDLAPVVDPLADALTHEHNIRQNLYTGADVIAARERIPEKAAKDRFQENKRFNDAQRDEQTLAGFKQRRVGQSGNRPLFGDEPKQNAGSGVTAARGNNPLIE